MSRFLREQVAVRWQELHRPRGFLAGVAAWILTALILVVALGLVVIAAAIAIPVGLVLGVSLWVRARFRAFRGINPSGDDGRRNVRIRGIPSSP
ncbi:MAG: hypothetical protein KDA05_12225 [Phycisphaerales bacterium]|nr:hypothetical protein [Phycisphaerales bacterium]